MMSTPDLVTLAADKVFVSGRLAGMTMPWSLRVDAKLANSDVARLTGAVLKDGTGNRYELRSLRVA